MRAFAAAGGREAIRHRLVLMLRAGGLASLTAAITDTQSVKTTEQGGARGCDAAKRVKHVAVDSSGSLLGVIVHAGEVQDADGVGDLLRRLKRLYPWREAVFADGASDRRAALLACFLLGLTLIVIRRLPGSEGFVRLPRRWATARTLGRFGRWRRRAKDDEELPVTSLAITAKASSRRLGRRWKGRAAASQ
jgi:putative transposase